VTRVRRNAKLALVAVAGAAVGALLSRWRRPPEAPPGPPDQRAEELRQKLAEARAAVADEADFEAAGMGAETLVEEPAPTEPPLDYVETPPPAAEEPPPEPEPAPEPDPVPEPDPEPKPRAKEREKPAEAERPPSDEFEAMRRRIHEEGRSAAEEMRRSGEKPDQA
jgi:outer membrane biosynthesis protein TonB